MLENSIIEKILSSWVTAAKTRNHEEMAKNVPAASDLKTLLETVYITSTKKEEGRPIKTRIAFFPNYVPEDLKEPSNYFVGFPFKESIQLSTKNLRKLSLAFEQENAALAVTGSDGRYSIIGALFYGKSKSRLDSGTSWRPRPNSLILASRSPGSVIISFGDSVVGRFEDGEFIVANPGPFGSSVFVAHVLEIISSHPQHGDHPDYWYYYRDCLTRLYSNVINSGHGGTIVWVPTMSTQDVEADLHRGIKMGGIISGADLLGKFLDKKHIFPNESHNEDHRRELSEYIGFLSALACIDGALIINDKLAPLRFGAHLTSDEWNGPILEGPVGQERPNTAIDVSRYGTKHQSAVRFAGAHPGTVLFVISEDGPVRAISQFKSSVLIWPDCLNTVFLD